MTTNDAKSCLLSKTLAVHVRRGDKGGERHACKGISDLLANLRQANSSKSKPLGREGFCLSSDAQFKDAIEWVESKNEVNCLYLSTGDQLAFDGMHSLKLLIYVNVVNV